MQCRKVNKFIYMVHAIVFSSQCCYMYTTANSVMLLQHTNMYMYNSWLCSTILIKGPGWERTQGSNLLHYPKERCPPPIWIPLTVLFPYSTYMYTSYTMYLHTGSFCCMYGVGHSLHQVLNVLHQHNTSLRKEGCGKGGGRRV